MTKSTDILSIDISSGKHQQSSIHQSQTGKKDQDHQQEGSRCQNGQRRGCSHNSPAMDINTSTVKKEVKNVSPVKCYNCDQKVYYATKCPQKPKN